MFLVFYFLMIKPPISEIINPKKSENTIPIVTITQGVVNFFCVSLSQNAARNELENFAKIKPFGG